MTWADGEPGQNGSFGPGGDLHANFSFAAGGEAIELYRPYQSQVDVISFGAQTVRVELLGHAQAM